MNGTTNLNSLSTIYVYAFNSENDFKFRAVVNDGFARFKGHSYIVAPSSDGKRFYGVQHGPFVPAELVSAYITGWLANN